MMSRGRSARCEGGAAAAALGAEEDGGGGRWGVVGGEGGGVGAEGAAEWSSGISSGRMLVETMSQKRDMGHPGWRSGGGHRELLRGLGIVWLCCGRGRGGCGR